MTKTDVPLEDEGGTFVVPAVINNAVTLKFLVVSGASDVSIPADVVSTLVRTGTLSGSDFIGSQTYTLADGSSVPSYQFRIRSLKVGTIELRNVTASLSDVKGQLLLGQSFLTRMNDWSIDNAHHILHLKTSDAEASSSTLASLPKTTESYEASVDYDDIEFAAQKFDEVLSKTGISGAVAYSKACHKSASSALSWSAVDRCAAFDYAAGYVDAAVAGGFGRDPINYFVFEKDNQADNYRPLGAVTDLDQRLPSISRAAIRATTEVLNARFARNKAPTSSSSDAPVISNQSVTSAGNSSE